MRVLMCLMIFLAVSGCASRSSFSLVDGNALDHNKGFVLGEITVTLQDPAEASVFPDEDGLASLFNKFLDKELDERGMHGSGQGSNELNCEIDYERVYSWSVNSGSLNHQKVSHVCQIVSNGEVLAVSRRGPYKAYHGYFRQGRRNWSSIFLRAGPESEKEDIALLAMAMVRDLERVRP